MFNIKEKIIQLVAKIFEPDFSIDEELIYYISGSEALAKPLTKIEEEELIKEWGIDSDYVRAKLIEHNLRLVVFIAKKFEHTGAEIEDLISIGTMGLIKAVKTFNFSKNIKLATYATRCIQNEILMYLRRTVKLRAEISLDEPLALDFDGNELLIADVLGTESDAMPKNMEKEVEKEILIKSLEKLKEKEMLIIKWRYGLNGCTEKTQKEVAEMMGISQSYISRLEKRILIRLKKDIDKLL
ncbi:MAG: sigma-70 family RNA polymerase sigma factor [Clostridia bacterium]|jgi:RNA polymerase sporulation-specific sigma factor|nr:sigma-70 family RNA polymerase sigma factor [Clostridia bacterium]